MIVTTHQPIFLPWPGFYFKALAADRLVLLDDVQFPLGRGWMTRNRLKSDRGELWLTVPVWRRGRSGQFIREVGICDEGDWRGKHLRGVRQQYAHAPYLEEVWRMLSAVYGRRHRRLVDFNVALIQGMGEALGLADKFILQSQLGVTGTGTGLLVSLCRALNADAYVTLAPVEKYLDGDLFRSSGVRLTFERFRPPVYPQLWGEFRYNLSALDMLLNCGPKSLGLVAGGRNGREAAE